MKLVACAVMLFACGGHPDVSLDASGDATPTADAPDAPPAPFRGVVSLNTNLSRTDPIQNYRIEYPAAFAAGARGAQTAAEWAALEPSPNGQPCSPTYDLTMITNPYFGLATLEADGFTDILLNISIISMDKRSMPCDLAALAFDDPAVVARYHAVLDRVAPYLDDTVKYVSLGNEIDSYFKAPAHAGEWVAYKALIEDARVYLRGKKPNLQIGVTTTFAGTTSTFAAEIASLDEHMDVTILTYYPLDFATYKPRDPSTVAPDLAAMVAVSGNRPLVLQEWGYPSSALLASDEPKQAAFVTNTFAEWTSYGADKIPFVSFFKRRDWTQAYCDSLCPVSPAPPICTAFGAYLCSLGVLNNDGTAKLGYQTLVDQITTLQIGR